MSNPYAQPREGSQETSRNPANDSFADDPELKRLAGRSRFCGWAIGYALGIVGAVQAMLVYAAVRDGHFHPYHAVLAAVAATLLTIALFAVLGQTWPIYASAALSMLWLGYLAMALPSQLATERKLPAPVLVLLFLAVATPGFVGLAAAAYRIVLDRAIRRRRALASGDVRSGSTV